MPGVFNDYYQNLNADQRAAVDNIEGPLLVIAGPGTGKTQLLSLRAANILSKTDVLPDNILCLTFTESGASEMRNRLINIIGEDAYKVGVYTYHGFGSEIIRSYSSYFNNGFNLRPINSLKSETIIRELQKNLPFTSDLKDPKNVNGIASIISDFKESILKPNDLLAIAKDNLEFIEKTSVITRDLTQEIKRASLKSVDNFKKLLISSGGSQLKPPTENLSSLWQSELAEAIDQTLETKKATSISKWKSKFLTKDANDLYIVKGEHQNNRLIELAGIYDDYQNRLEKEYLYDYDDMILMAIDVISKNNDLRYSLQEKYLYIMLDEFQDTNKAQAKLIELLTNNEVLEGRPNVMAVGDDDQAIYAFQGAKYSNMIDFVNQYNDVAEITLKTNYRSTQALIDISSKVSNQISQRLTKLLNVNKLFKSSKDRISNITSLSFSNEIGQYTWLANELKSNKETDIAIIAPEHKYLERASAYLIENNIDISYERRENVLDDSLIEQVLTILELLLAMKDKKDKQMDVHLATVLNYDFFQLPTELIWKISWKAHDERKPWLEIMLTEPQVRPIALMLMKMSANTLSASYDQVIDEVIGLSEIEINDPKLKATRSPIYDYLKTKNDEMLISKLFQNLLAIREEYLDFNADNNKPLLLEGFIDFIHELKASAIKITNDFNYGQLDARIKLLTAHSAKGQEFQTVYLISFVNNVWGPKNSNNNRLSLPPNLQYIRHGAEDVEDEKLRLLYVALTRAKDNLFTLSYEQDAAGKLTTPLKYLNIESTKVKENYDPKLIPLWQKDEVQTQIKTSLKNLLKKRLASYSLSPTELNTFIDVRNAGPSNFYKSVLLKYKSPSGPRADYGSAVHDALDWMQKTLNSTGKLPTIEDLINEFEKELIKKRMLPEDFKHLKEQGIKALMIYYNKNLKSFSTDDLSEYNFRSEGIVIGGARLSGKIDKLALNKNDKAIDIVDYKTGKGYDRWEAKPKLHLYQNQLYFYELLVSNSTSFKGYRVNESRLEFVEPDVSTGDLYKLVLAPSREQQERFIKLITAVNTHIHDLNFPSVKAYPETIAGIIRFENDLIDGKI